MSKRTYEVIVDEVRSVHFYVEAEDESEAEDKVWRKIEENPEGVCAMFDCDPDETGDYEIADVIECG